MKKKLISLLLAGAMVLSLAACGGEENNQAADGGNQSSTQGNNQTADQTSGAENGSDGTVADDFTYPMAPITFTVNGSAAGGEDYYDDSAHPSWAQDIYIHKVIRDMTGVTLIDAGGASNATTISDDFLLMLAGGELTDFIVGPLPSYPGGVDALIDEGYIVNLLDYADSIPNLVKFIDENPEIAAQILTDDGRLGFAPFVKEKPYTGMGLVIRKDWLEALNLDVPETVDEMHNVLVAFKENYNCAAPLSFEARWLFLQGAAGSISNAWGSMYQDYIVDGQIHFGPLEEEYKEFIATLAQWYDEGLLDHDFASVDKTTVQAKFSSGEAGVTIQQINNIENCISANEGTDYAVVALESLVMNKGDERLFGGWNSILKYDGGFCMAISTTCPDIEAACRYLDWRFTEEGMMAMNYGVEGVTYEIVNGEVQFTELITNNEETPNATTARDEISMNQNRAGVSLNLTLAFTDYAKEWVGIWEATDSYILPVIPYTEAQQEIISKNWSDIDNYCQEMILKYVIGTEDLSGWDSFVEEIKKMKAEDVLAAKQEAYDLYLQKVESLK